MNYKKYVFFIGLLISGCAMGMEESYVSSDLSLTEEDLFPHIGLSLFEGIDQLTPDSTLTIGELNDFEKWTNQGSQNPLVKPCVPQAIAVPAVTTPEVSKVAKISVQKPRNKHTRNKPKVRARGCIAATEKLDDAYNLFRNNSSKLLFNSQRIEQSFDKHIEKSFDGKVGSSKPCNKILSKKVGTQKRYYCLAIGCNTYSLWESSMIKHLQAHGDPLRTVICSIPHCHAAFTSDRDMMRHLRSFHEKEVFPCREGCPMSFTSTEERVKHESCKHRE